MKKSFLLLCVALTLGVAMMASCKKDNGGESKNSTDPKDKFGLTIGPFVDMGGSVLWCSHNLGTNSPFESGEFYDFMQDREGDASDIDYQLTGKWRVPTKDEVEELLKNQQRVTLNEVNGYLLTGTNGNTLFIPCAGKNSMSTIILQGTDAYFWTSSQLDSDRPYSANGEWEKKMPMEVEAVMPSGINKLPLRVVMNKE